MEILQAEQVNVVFFPALVTPLLLNQVDMSWQSLFEMIVMVSLASQFWKILGNQERKLLGRCGGQTTSLASLITSGRFFNQHSLIKILKSGGIQVKIWSSSINSERLKSIEDIRDQSRLGQQGQVDRELLIIFPNSNPDMTEVQMVIIRTY